MPWRDSDASKHIKGLSKNKQDQWSSVANEVLKRTGNEAQAIRTANGVVSRSSVKRRLTRGKK